MLLIEVAQSSLSTDRGAKLAAYAQAGVADYWIVNLVDQQLEVYRQPNGLEYREKSVLRGSEAASPLALPAATFAFGDLLSKPGEG